MYRSASSRAACTALVVATLACAAPRAITPAPAPDPFAPSLALLAEADARAAGDIWPDFDFRSIPVAIFDGERTLLLRHPSPPPEFVRVPGGEVYAAPGRHAAVFANSSAQVGGVMTATVMPADSLTLRQRAGVLVHEAFHVHQRARHPGWTANEVELFTYPAEDVRLLALRRMETEALHRALVSPGPPASGGSECWARAALELRRERFSAMPPGATMYERRSELAEGLARYVQLRVTGTADRTLLEGRRYPADGIRHRVYESGAALGRLLDRHAPGWRSTLTASDSLSLDELLSRSLGPPRGPGVRCGIAAQDRARVEREAAADVQSLRERRTAARSSFLEAPGWRLVIDAASAPLFPQGFDPLNVQVLGAGDVLHTRYLKLGNSSGGLEVLGRSSLTTAAGAHPLFNGVRQLRITGLAVEPTVEQLDGVVRIRSEQLYGELRDASVEREGSTITVRLRGR